MRYGKGNNKYPKYQFEQESAMKQTAKAVFTATPNTFADDAAVAAASDMAKIRNEYQNQPALAQVGAADAYARGADSSTISTYVL